MTSTYHSSSLYSALRRLGRNKVTESFHGSVDLEAGIAYFHGFKYDFIALFVANHIAPSRQTHTHGMFVDGERTAEGGGKKTAQFSEVHLTFISDPILEYLDRNPDHHFSTRNLFLLFSSIF